MNNQSIVALPPDLEDPMVLKRFLAKLVEQIDVVLGNKAEANKKPVNQEQLIEASKQLSQLLKDAEVTLKRTLELTKNATEKDIDALTEKVSASNIRNNQQDDRLDAIEIVDGQQNDRLNNIENAGYLTDAPFDGNSYARKDGAWVIIP